MKKDPTRRPKNVPHLIFEEKRCKHSTFAKQQGLQISTRFTQEEIVLDSWRIRNVLVQDRIGFAILTQVEESEKLPGLD